MPELNPDQFDKVQRVSPQHLMEATKPGDDPSWQANRKYIEQEHFKMGGRHTTHWSGFVDDIARRGVRRPIIVHEGKITNGHHRLFAADLTGRETVPVVVRKKYRRS